MILSFNTMHTVGTNYKSTFSDTYGLSLLIHFAFLDYMKRQGESAQCKVKIKGTEYFQN